MRQYLYPNGAVNDVESVCANALLFAIELPDGTLYLTDSPVDVVYGGQTYLASGYLLGAPSLSPTVDEPIDDIDLALSAVDLQLLSLIGDSYHNAPVIVHRIWQHDDYSIAAVDRAVWSGIVNNYTDSETATSHELTLNLTNELATFAGAHGLQLTVDAHQRLHPADTGMRHALVVDTPEGEWGHEDRRQDGGLTGADIYTPGVSVDLNLDTTAKRAPLVFGRQLIEPITVMRQITGQDDRYLASIDLIAAGRIKGIVSRFIDGVDLLTAEGRDYFGVGQTGNGKPYITHWDERLADDASAYPWLLNYPAGVQYPGKSDSYPDFVATDEFAGLTTALTVHRNHVDAPWSGQPTRTYVVDGALVWDPRDSKQSATNPGSWQWSSNPALCALHFMRLPKALGGMGLAEERLLIDEMMVEANWIDATKEVGGDGLERPVMTCNLVLDTSQPVMDNLTAILATCRGRLVRRGGQFGFAIDRERSSVLHLDENDFAEIEFSAPDVDDRYNQVSVEYLDASNNYVTNTASWPTLGSADYAEYLSADRSVENHHSETAHGIDNHDEALQLAEVLCRRSRSAATGTLSDVSPKCARLEVGDVFTLDDADRGWVGKLLEVVTVTIDGSADAFKVSLEFVVYDSSEFAWSDKPLQPPPPNYGKRPVKSVPSVTNIEYVGPTDLQPQGRVTWDHDSDDYGWTDHYNVSISKNGTQVASGTSPDGDYPVPTLDAGDYLITVVRVTTLGKSSVPASLSFTLALPSVPVIGPDDLDIGNSSVGVTPQLSGLAYHTEFEFAIRGRSQTEPLRIKGRTRGTFIFAGLAPEVEWFFAVRAVNPLGVSAWVEVSATTTAIDPALLDSIGEEINKQVGDMDDRLSDGALSGIKDIIERNKKQLSDSKQLYNFEDGVIEGLRQEYTAEFAASKAYLEQTYMTSADTTHALALSEQRMSAEVGEVYSHLGQQYLTAASTESAISTAIDEFTVTGAHGGTATLEQMAAAVWSADGNSFETQWSVKSDVNGLKGGVGFYNNGTKTEFLIDADVFAVLARGADTEMFNPLVVANGQVYMRDVLMDFAQVVNLDVRRLDALNIKTNNLEVSKDVTVGGTSGSYAAIRGSVSGRDELVFVAGHTNAATFADWRWGVDSNGRMVMRDGYGDYVLDFNPASGKFELSATLQSSVIKASVLDLDSTRIAADGDRTATFAISQVDLIGTPGETYSSLSLTLPILHSPSYGAGFMATRFSQFKQDVLIDALLTGDKGFETLKLQVQYNGGAWQTIKEVTRDLSYHGTLRLVCRYTTLTSWSFIRFRGVTNQDHSEQLSIRLDVNNCIETANSAGSVS
ncbi:phage tail protein [Ferrimonas aestuarii]|uniref:DUF1983 domain-containing protein n=1 Tax=Ferrimonas aestuarii TaxID=2569539 RepID=A0A4U1BN70_9GAMM|nr:phage tail protein [Ferrimonas aestuarii]TKB53309.1 DUF1983 domain-containing protein [Ferrimonas aestuarii]